MRKTVFPLVLLFSAFAQPFSAHADTIDDFLLTGNGETITFSLPASPAGNLSTCPTGVFTSCLPGSETAFYLSTVVTTDGVSSEEGLAFPTERFGGGLVIGGVTYGGDQQLFTPDAAYPTFLQGTFEVYTTTFGIPLDYSLAISPDSSVVPTPEPASVALFATGILGLLGVVKTRQRKLRP